MSWILELEGELVLLGMRSLLLLFLACGLAVVWRRAAAGVRRSLWVAAFAGLAVLPGLALLGPGFSMPVLPAGILPVSTAGTATEDDLRTLPAPVPEEPEPVRWRVRPAPVAGGAESRPATGEGPSSSGGAPFGTAAGRIWLGGLLFLLLRIGLGLGRLEAWRRASPPFCSDLWEREADEVRRELGLGARVELREGPAGSAPVIWGLRRAVLRLPPEAKSWPAERRRIVLFHELLHVRQRDAALRLAASLVAAVHWMNPLVWYARSRLVLEQEMTCDDRVLARGVLPSTYARHLLAIAEQASCRRPPVLAVGMARRSQLEVRMMSILQGSRSSSVVLPVVVLLLAVPALAALAPAPQQTPTLRAEPRSSGRAVASEEEESVQSVLREIELVEGEMAPLLEELERVETQMEPVAERLEGLELETEPSQALVEEIELELEPFDRRLAEVERELRPHEEELEAIELEMAPLQERIELAEEDLAPLQLEAEGIELRARELELRGRPLARQERELGRELELLHRRLETDSLSSEERRELENRVSLLQSQTVELHEQMRQLHEAQAPLHEAMRDLERRMRSRHEAMAELHAELEPYHERMREVHERMRPIHHRLQEVHQEMQPIHERLGEVHREMEPVHRRMEAFHQEMRPLYRELEAVHERLAPFHDRMAQLHERLRSAVDREVASILEQELGGLALASDDLDALASRVGEAVQAHHADGRLVLRGSAAELRRILLDGGRAAGADSGLEGAVERAIERLLELEL